MDPLTNTYYGVPHLQHDPRAELSSSTNRAASPSEDTERPEAPDRNYSDKVALLAEDGRDYSDKVMVFSGPLGTVIEPGPSLSTAPSWQNAGEQNTNMNTSKVVTRKPIPTRKPTGSPSQVPGSSHQLHSASGSDLFLAGQNSSTSSASHLRTQKSFSPSHSYTGYQDSSSRPDLAARSVSGGSLPYPDSKPQPQLWSQGSYAPQRLQSASSGRLPYPEHESCLPLTQVPRYGSFPSVSQPPIPPRSMTDQTQQHVPTSSLQRTSPTPISGSPHVNQHASPNMQGERRPPPLQQQRHVPSAGSQPGSVISSPPLMSPPSPTIPTSPKMSPTDDDYPYFAEGGISPTREVTTFVPSSTTASEKVGSQAAQTYRPVADEKDYPVPEAPWSPESYHSPLDQVPSYEQAMRTPSEHRSPILEAGPITTRSQYVNQAPGYAPLRTQSGSSDRLPPIIQAVRENRLDIVQALVTNGIDINTTDSKTQRSALSEASSLGYNDIAAYLVTKGCNLEHRDRDGNNALHLAVLSNCSQIVDTLLATNRFPVDREGQNGESALFMASNTSYDNTIIRSLIKAHANPNLRDQQQRTPLHNAAARGITLFCSLLIDAGAEVSPLDLESRTPLHMACLNNHAAVVTLLLPLTPHPKTNSPLVLPPFFAALSSGSVSCATPFLQDSKIVSLKKLKSVDSYKPLHFAAASGNVSLLHLLISYKAALKERDPLGYSALHDAAAGGHGPMISALLSKGLSARLTTSKKKETPLHLALRAPYPAAATALLADKSCPVSARDKHSNEPLHHCARHGLFELAGTLLDKGASPGGDSRYGWKPIHLAAAYGHPRMVELLLARGAKVDDKLGESRFKAKKKTISAVREGYVCEARWPHPGIRPLGLALEFGREDVVRLLLNRSAKIEERDNEGWRALHYAAWSASTSMAALLLQQGAYPHALTAKGNPPSAVGYRDGVDEREVMQVRDLLIVAMDKKKKGLKEGLSEAIKVGNVAENVGLGALKLGGKKEEDRNASWKRAQIAEELMAKGEDVGAEDDDDDDEEVEEGRSAESPTILQRP